MENKCILGSAVNRISKKMRGIKSFWLLSLIALLACGQGKKGNLPITSKDSLKVDLYKQKSILYQNKQPDSAVYFADKGLQLSQRLHYQLGEAIMLDRLARINEQYDNLKLAEKYQKKSLFIFNKIHNIPGTADASASLGILEGKSGNFLHGSELIKKALAVYLKSKDTSRIIQGYTKMGEIKELSGDTKQALEYYNKAQHLNKDMPVSDDYFSLISTIGNLHSKLGNHQKAAGYYQTGINKSNGIGKYGKSHITLLNNAAKAWNALGDKDKALSYHRQGLQKATAMGLDEEAARSLMGIANVLKDEDADASIVHLKNALAIAKTIGNKQLSTEIYHSLSDIYRQQSRYQEALMAFEQHHKLLDSLLNANRMHKITVLQSSYALTESRLHIESLELANQAKTYQRNVGIFAFFAILLILLILAGYFYKIRRLNKRLQISNLIKDKLFSIIGHDLRNPIGGITQLLSVMEEENLTIEEYKLMVSEMRKQGDVTLEILNGLLNWGEAQLKGIPIQSTHFNPKINITKNLEALYKHANDKQLEIIDNVPSDLMLYGDANHFDFIMRNLLSNAIKFSYPNGKIVIGATTQEGSPEVIFSVTDNGKGISTAQQQLFLKADLEISYGTKGEKGTGIGLMLIKEFLKANGQRIWLVSEEGKGTAFYFSAVGE